MKTTQKKVNPERLSKLNTMLADLSDKEVAMIEAMVNSRSKVELDEEEDSLEDILIRDARI